MTRWTLEDGSMTCTWSEKDDMPQHTMTIGAFRMGSKKMAAYVYYTVHIRIHIRTYTHTIIQYTYTQTCTVTSVDKVHGIHTTCVGMYMTENFTVSYTTLVN